MANQPTTPQRTPQKNKALLRAYEPLVSLNKAFLKGGGWLIRHKFSAKPLVDLRPFQIDQT